MSHVTAEGLPFCGVGHSGMGAYHGKFGFLTFPYPRGLSPEQDGGSGTHDAPAFRRCHAWPSAGRDLQVVTAAIADSIRLSCPAWTRTGNAVHPA